MTMPPFKLSFNVATPVVSRQPRKARRGARPKCSTPECESESHTRGLCAAHYKREWRRKDGTINRRAVTYESDQECAVDGCKGKCRSKGLCGDHYYETFLLDHGEKTASPETVEAMSDSVKERLKTLPVRMDSGELRIDYMRKRVAERKNVRSKKKKQKKRERQKYDHLAATVNKNDTEWGEDYEHG